MEVLDKIGTHEALVWGKEDSDAGVNLANSQGDKHRVHLAGVASFFVMINWAFELVEYLREATIWRFTSKSRLFVNC